MSWRLIFWKIVRISWYPSSRFLKISSLRFTFAGDWSRRVFHHNCFTARFEFIIIVLLPLPLLTGRKGRPARRSQRGERVRRLLHDRQGNRFLQEVQEVEVIDGSIILEVDASGGALIHAGPAFDAILSANWTRPVFLQLIDFTGADLDTVFTTRTFFPIDNRMHKNFRFKLMKSSKPLSLRNLCSFFLFSLTSEVYSLTV